MENEKIVDYLVVSSKPGRSFTTDVDNKWGGLIKPGPNENVNKNNKGLKVVLFASWDFGYLVQETLKKYEEKHPDHLNLVGLVTDNPLNPKAKISLKKRIWNHLEIPDRVIDETLIIESALSYGMQAYTGDVKVESFRRLLEEWNPDVIIVCVFGQVIDSFTIQLPPFGVYNLHPSDLTKKQGAGPAPYEDLAKRKVGTSVWSVHHVSEEIDKGVVVGLSPKINILDDTGNLPSNPIVVYHKLAEVLSPLTFFLVNELVRNIEMKKPGWINYIDFESLFPYKIKDKILQSVTSDKWTDIQSLPDGYLFNPD